MTTYLPYTCPDCGTRAAVRISYLRANGDQYRVRECPDCGRFATLQNGGPEQFDRWTEKGAGRRPVEEPEIEPLDLDALDPAEELRERLRLLFIWCKAAVDVELRPVGLRNGNGYEGDRERDYYDDY